MRRHRCNAANFAQREHCHRDPEAERLIEVASTWAPFGGIPEEETLVQFGMTVHRFIERLCQVIPESKCTEDEILYLTGIYSHRRAPEQVHPFA